MAEVPERGGTEPGAASRAGTRPASPGPRGGSGPGAPAHAASRHGEGLGWNSASMPLLGSSPTTDPRTGTPHTLPGRSHVFPWLAFLSRSRKHNGDRRVLPTPPCLPTQQANQVTSLLFQLTPGFQSSPTTSASEPTLLMTCFSSW